MQFSITLKELLLKLIKKSKNDIGLLLKDIINNLHHIIQYSELGLLFRFKKYKYNNFRKKIINSVKIKILIYIYFNK